MSVRFRINRRGVAQLQNELSQGLEAVADRLLDACVATSPVELVRDPAITRDSLHTDKSHSREWPRPAVFVATASGDGFFVHEGTVDTPAQPWMSRALDSMIRDIPSLMRGANLGRRGRGNRTAAFTELNRSLPARYQTHRT